jgi:hypothetical protein
MFGLGLAAAGTGLAKLGIGAKLASAVGMAKGLAGGAAARQLAIPGLMGAGKAAAAQTAARGGLGAVKKFAGKALADYMGPGGVTAKNLATNFGMDAAFGLYQGAMTPGDLGDKLIAGVGTGVGGAMGGVGLVSALGKHKNNAIARLGAELGGNLVGDMGGQIVSDAVLRAKGGGTTPWEKLQQEGDQQYRQEIERQMLAQLGIGGYNQTDLIG